MSEQLDLFSSYECDPRGATGMYIWYSNCPWGKPDLYCDIVSIKGQYIVFSVINGTWEGRLDLANKTMRIFHPWYEDSVHLYHKYEFIYYKPKKVLDTDNIPS